MGADWAIMLGAEHTPLSFSFIFFTLTLNRKTSKNHEYDIKHVTTFPENVPTNRRLT